MIHLDTHVAIWLAGRRQAHISPAAKRLIDRQSLLLSPMALFELETLHETGKLSVAPEDVLAVLQRNHDLSVSAASFASIIETACTFAWTRDPFDRLIVANAMADAARLLTADGLILENFRDAVW